MPDETYAKFTCNFKTGFPSVYNLKGGSLFTKNYFPADKIFVGITKSLPEGWRFAPFVSFWRSFWIVLTLLHLYVVVGDGRWKKSRQSFWFNLFMQCCKMAKHTLKILRCSHHKIFKVCLAILQHYAWKG